MTTQYVETPTKSFAGGAALGQYRRCKLSSGLLQYAGSQDLSIGTLEAATFADTNFASGYTNGTLRLSTAQGTRIMVASEAIAAGANVYGAASGKIAASGQILEGVAMEAASADGDLIEVMPIQATGLGANFTEVVTATNVIAANESGSVFFLNSATEFVSTLPAPAAGLRFTFIVTAAPSGASYTIVTNSSANIIKGSVYSSDLNAASDADFETSGGDTISFVDSKAVAGDRVELWCDGTNWFMNGFCTAFDAITITTAS